MRIPSVLRQVAITKTEPGDENNQDISSLVGKVDIRKLEIFSQNDPDAYSYSGGLCLANQGLLEFVEMFKAPIKMLHPLLTATQEGNFKGTEGFSAIPFNGLILAHSNESEWHTFRNNKNNEAFLDRIFIVKVPYCLRVFRGSEDLREAAAEQRAREQSLRRETPPRHAGRCHARAERWRLLFRRSPGGQACAREPRTARTGPARYRPGELPDRVVALELR